MWDFTEESGSLHVQKIAFKYGVELCGWPEDVSFQSPASMPAKQLEQVLVAMRLGRIYFRKLPLRTLEWYAQMSGSHLVSERVNVGRADKAQRRPPRPVETRSKKKIKRGIKTARFVNTED